MSIICVSEFAFNQLFFVQLLGFISMAIGWWANSQKQDCKFIHGNMLASILTAIHLGLLGSFLGMANQLVNVVRFRCCQQLGHTTKSEFVPLMMSVTFSTVAILQGVMWAEHWSEWCAVFAAVVMSISLFYCKGMALRAAMLVSNALNLMLSIYLMSWSGILYQVMTITILAQSVFQQYKQIKLATNNDTISSNQALSQ